MDLLNTIRKTGSRGGTNFSWDEVANSSHRENYLGHSLKAPVGRWQQGKDLNWYAKNDATPGDSTETDDARIERERKEEIRRIKEAEEDAIARTLGLPIPQRNTSGANAVEVDNQRQLGADNGPPPGGDESGKTQREQSRRHDPERRERRRHRSRSRSRQRDEDRGSERHRRRRSQDRPSRRHRSRDRHGRDRDEKHHRSQRRRSRSRSREGVSERRDERHREGRDGRRERPKHGDNRDRSQSPRRPRRDD